MSDLTIYILGTNLRRDFFHRAKTYWNGIKNWKFSDTNYHVGNNIVYYERGDLLTLLQDISKSCKTKNVGIVAHSDPSTLIFPFQLFNNSNTNVGGPVTRGQINVDYMNGLNFEINNTPYGLEDVERFFQRAKTIEGKLLKDEFKIYIQLVRNMKFQNVFLFGCNSYSTWNDPLKALFDCKTVYTVDDIVLFAEVHAIDFLKGKITSQLESSKKSFKIYKTEDEKIIFKYINDTKLSITDGLIYYENENRLNDFINDNQLVKTGNTKYSFFAIKESQTEEYKEYASIYFQSDSGFKNKLKTKEVWVP